MSFISRIRDMAQQGAQQGQSMFSRFKNGPFADASMAACALIAAADGMIEPEEKRKTAAFIGSNPNLKDFDSNDLQKKFLKYADQVTADFDMGKIGLMQTIGKVKKPEEARAVVQLACLIGAADGDFDDKEKAVVREICHALSIQPSEFGL